MSVIRIDSGTSYIIPVDSIDMAYISNYLRSTTEEKRSLWTKSLLDGKAELFKVQIGSPKAEECYSESTDTYNCHICNLHVPVTCSKEHNQSEQHKTIKKIYQKALVQLSKEIDMTVVDNKEKMDDNVYYCIPCSMIIKKENRNNHESSEFHTKSCHNEIIVSEFYNIMKNERNSSSSIFVVEESSSNSLSGAVNSVFSREIHANNQTTVEDYLNNIGSTSTTIDNNIAIASTSTTVENNIAIAGTSKTVDNNIAIASTSKTVDSNIAIASTSKTIDNNIAIASTSKTVDSNIAIASTSKTVDNNMAIASTLKTVDNNIASTSKTIDSNIAIASTSKTIDNNIAIASTSKTIDNNIAIASTSTTIDNNIAIAGPSNNNDEIQVEEKNAFEEHLKDMIEKYQLECTLPMMMADEICIGANGNLVVVSKEHFQSYKRLENGICCQMCGMEISNDTNSHDVSEDHVKNIFKPINENFARTIDDSSSHCLPCNIVVLDAEHPLQNAHKKVLKDTRVRKPGHKFCEDCNVYVDHRNYTAHSISKRHLKIIMTKHSITKTTLSPNICFCNICELLVSKNAIKNHVETKAHLSKKNNDGNDLESNHTESPATSPLPTREQTQKFEYCNICQVRVPNGGMQLHSDGKSHKRKENKLRESTAQNTSGSSTSVTNNNTLLNASTSTRSTNSNDTTTSAGRILGYFDLIEFPVNSPTEVQCKICLTYLAFVENIIIDHMESKYHIQQHNKQKMIIYKKYLSQDNAEDTVFCEICHVNIPKSDLNIIEHMEGKNHDLAKISLLEFNLMTREGPMEYICECCHIITPNFFDHINGKVHTIKFLLNEDVDKNEMRRYVYDDESTELIAHHYRDRHRNMLKHSDINKLDDNNFYCGMCRIKLGRINELDHLLGEKHAVKLRKLLETRRSPL